MTRILRIDTCDRCPYAIGSRACGHEDVLWSDGVVDGRPGHLTIFSLFRSGALWNRWHPTGGHRDRDRTMEVMLSDHGTKNRSV